MRICHVTSHLPPDQAANALLPVHLGRWSVANGDTVGYVAYPPRAVATATADALAHTATALPGDVTWVPPRVPAAGLARALKLSSLKHAAIVRRVAEPVIQAADVVHVHSNGLLPEVAALLAAELGKPFVLTLYGTEIWHYVPRWFPPSLFTRMYRRAARVTFYSQGLLDRARELGLVRDGLSVVYPPVADYFQKRDEPGRAETRRTLGLTRRHVLLNVKRLHPLAGQRVLLEAMPDVLRQHPDTDLVFCGTGPLADELSAQAERLGVGDHVRFLGLVDNEQVARYYAAADVFVLPSLLEACPTVAVEALASGTPVVSSDNPGGVELARLFGDDVRVVPREQAPALAAALVAALDAKRRTCATADTVLDREFRPGVSAARFGKIYRQLIDAIRNR
jgi:glycosyltransferase involved in cell wall biosynthesis